MFRFGYTFIFWCFALASLSAAGAPQVPYKWDAVTIGGGGFVPGLIFHPSEAELIYARTDVGGAYRWDKNQKRWHPLMDWVDEGRLGYLGVESLALDAKHPNRLYMSVGTEYLNSGASAVLISHDFGKTFTEVTVDSRFKAHGNGRGRQSGEKLQVDPNNSQVLYLGSRSAGLFKSIDGGYSWFRLNGLATMHTPSNNGISFVLLDPSKTDDQGTSTLYVGISRIGENNIFVSHDGGITFSAIPPSNSLLIPQRASLTSNGEIVVAYSNGMGPHPHWAISEPANKGGIYKFNTQTNSWKNITPKGVEFAFGSIDVYPSDPNRIVIATMNTWSKQNGAHGDKVYFSKDGGETWRDIIADGFYLQDRGHKWVNGHAIHWASSIRFNPKNHNEVWVGSGNGVFRTFNIEATPSEWHFNVNGLEESVPLGLVSIKGHPLVSIVGDYDGFMHPDIKDHAIIFNHQIGTNTGLDVAALNPKVMARSGEHVLVTKDAGASWQKSKNTKGVRGYVTLSAMGDALLHSPENSPTTYRSTDFGQTWQEVEGLNLYNARVIADTVNNKVFYAYGTDGRFWVSSNGGKSFSSNTRLASGGEKLIRAVPGYEGNIWVALNWQGLAHSEDGGKTFENISSVKNCRAVGFGANAPGSSYPTVFIWGDVDGQRGIFRSTNQGVSWVRVNDDAHQFGGPGNGQFVIGDMNVFGRVYMATVGRGIVYGEPL